MYTQVQKAIVRIQSPPGRTIGTGFVVTNDGLIATCAHVLEIARLQPGQSVDVSFLRKDSEARQALIEERYWRSSNLEDVAILRLSGELPPSVVSLPLRPPVGGFLQDYVTFGFPSSRSENGIWTRCLHLGITREKGYPIIQLRGNEITTGYSGSPVCDIWRGVTVGMVSSVLESGQSPRGVETAFIIPEEAIRKVCPEIKLLELPAIADPSGAVHDAKRAYEGGDFPRAIILLQGVLNSVGPIGDADELIESARYAEQAFNRELSEIARRTASEDVHDLMIGLKTYEHLVRRYPLHPERSEVEDRISRLRRAIDYLNERDPSRPPDSRAHRSGLMTLSKPLSVLLWILIFSLLFGLAVVLGLRILNR